MPSLFGKVLNAAPPSPPPVPLAERGSLPGVAFSASSGAAQDAAYLRSYKRQPTVRANVGLLAQSVASQPWGLFRSDPEAQGQGNRWTTSDQGSDQRQQVFQHAALALLLKPNQFWSRFKLFEISQMWFDLTGKCHWVIGSTGGIPTSVWPVRPDRMIPVPDDKVYLKGWLYMSPDGREQVPLLPSQVIYNATPDPEDPYGGTGPAQAVLDQIDGAAYAAEWNRNFFANSARPDGIIQTDGTLSDDEWDELTNRWRESHRGVARAHRVAVLEGGATWQATSTSPKDMDFANLLSTGSDQIREAWGIHKVMTGVTEDVNRANAQTGEETFAAWQVDPRLRRWRDVLNHQYLPLFGATAQGVELDYKPAIPPNREEDRLELQAKVQAAQMLVGSGYDPHDVLQVVGLPDMNVVEKATQAPALPPAWVPEMPGGMPAGGSGGAPDEKLLGQPEGEAVAALLRAIRDGRASAAWNMLERSGR
jgi:HK97 family phage portal protein